MTIQINQSYTITDKEGNSITFKNGIEYAKYLRKNDKFKDPIVFTSFLSLAQVLKHIANTQIIQAIGHGFIRLPFTDEELKEASNAVKPLTDLQLTDIIINYCQVRSAVRESFHILKGKLSQLQNSKDDKAIIANKVFAFFESYKQDLKRDVPDFPEVITAFENIIQKFDANDLSTLDAIRNQQEEALTAYLPAEDDKEEERSGISKNWEVLFLDDRPDELSPIFEILDKRGIGYHVTTSAVEAEAKISADLLNKITVVVSDYRLFEPEEPGISSPRMQPKQGYDFLIDLSKRHDRFNSFIALSGLSKWFLMESFRKEQIDVKVYSKGSLLGGGHKLFVDDIEYLGEVFFDVICSQPISSAWHKDKLKDGILINKNYKSYYSYHRKHSNYQVFENEINDFTEKAARDIEHALDNKHEFYSDAIISLRGDTTMNLKGNIEEGYEDFKYKLKLRRIFYYLQCKGFTKEEIANILHDSKKAEIITISDGMVKQVTFQNAITENDIPYALLVEEKYFLKHHMGISIDNIKDIINSTHYIFNEIIQNHIKKEDLNQYSNYLASDGKTIVSVSMKDLGILTEKLTNNLLIQEYSNKAIGLLNEIRDKAEQLIHLLPYDKQLPELIKRLNKLEEKANKKNL